MTYPKQAVAIVAAVWLALALLPGPNPAAALPYTDLPAVNGSMLEAEYWIGKMADPDRVLMDLDQIRAFNSSICQQTADLTEGVHDLNRFPDTVSGEQLRGWMAIDPGQDPLYLAGASSPLDPAVLDEAIANMGSAGVQPSNHISYAVAVERSNMKCIPIAETVSDEPKDLEYDAFQYSVVLPGEPVLILHESLDRLWFFVQGYNCRGWVESRSLARASDQQWHDYITARDQRFVMVAANRLFLNENPQDARLSQLMLPMATRLPLADNAEIPALVDNQNPSGNWVVNMPVRDSNGQMELKMALIPGSADVTESFLPYTSANIIHQVFKTLGDRYGWGGMLNGRDCSALVMDLWACFGFTLPRNTSEQSSLRTGAVLELEGYSETYRSQLLAGLRPGAALYFPGHTMIYLGEEGGRHYVISALGSYAQPGKNGAMDIQRVHGTVVNDLSLKRRNGNTWMAELTEAQQYFGFHFTDLEGISGKDAAEYLADRFIVNGTSPQLFTPEGNLSRGELAALLMRAMKLEPAPEAAAFQDTKDHWSRGAIGAMIKKGLMNGVYAESFMPDLAVTRAELAAILTRCTQDSMMAYDEARATTLCSDFAEVPEWARPGVYQCLLSGTLEVREDRRFAPAETATRLEAAEAVYKFIL